MTDPAISVLITVYNGEKHLARTLEALRAQRFTAFEVLLGNDCSTDGSLALLKAYAKRDTRFRVLTTPNNLGTSPKTMNFLLPHVRGARLAYSSQDDLYSTDWLERMQARALETGADAVLPDLVFLRRDPRQNTMLIGVHGDREVELKGKEAVALSLDGTIHAFALWNAALVKRIGYAEFAMNSDEFTSRVLFDACNEVAFSSGTFFYWQDNPEAITKKVSVGTFDLPLTHLRQHQFLLERSYPAAVTNAELLRCVSSLIWMKQRLAVRRFSLGAAERRRADEKLRRVFGLLREPATRAALKELWPRAAATNKTKLALLELDYSAFAAACLAMGAARKVLGQRV